MNPNKKIQNLVFGHYNRMLKDFKTQKKNFGVERLPLTVVSQIIDISRLKPEETNDSKIKLFATKFNSTLDAIKTASEKASETINDGKLSLHEFRTLIEATKRSFLEGLYKRK